MAMNGEELGTYIAEQLADPKVPAAMRKSLTEQWQKLGKVLVDYFVANGEMVVYIPETENTSGSVTTIPSLTGKATYQAAVGSSENMGRRGDRD